MKKLNFYLEDEYKTGKKEAKRFMHIMYIVVLVNVLLLFISILAGYFNLISIITLSSLLLINIYLLFASRLIYRATG